MWLLKALAVEKVGACRIERKAVFSSATCGLVCTWGVEKVLHGEINRPKRFFGFCLCSTDARLLKAWGFKKVWVTS